MIKNLKRLDNPIYLIWWIDKPSFLNMISQEKDYCRFLSILSDFFYLYFKR